MNFDSIANIFGALVGVATITAIVSSPNTAPVIRAWGDAFSQSVRASLGH